MQTFTIPDAEVKFGHLNVRTEKHGPDDVTAVDLDLEWTTPNQALLQFHPDLLESMYAPENGRTKRLPGVEQSYPTRLYPKLAPLSWPEELTGLCLTIRHGINGDTDLTIPDATADKFLITLKDDGMVTIDLRVRAVCKDERVLGKLPGLLKRRLPMHLASQDGGTAADD